MTSSCLISIFQELPSSLFVKIICQLWIWLIILTVYQMRFIYSKLYKLEKSQHNSADFFFYLFSILPLQKPIPVAGTGLLGS